MPNGYADTIRISTKILKPFSLLRKLEHQFAVYIDDTLLIGLALTECAQNIDAKIGLLQLLGFAIHSEKSLLSPTSL